MLPQPMMPTPSVLGHVGPPQSFCAAAIERSAKRSSSLGLSCSIDEVLGLGRALQRGHQRLPVDGAVADVGPAVLVGVLAGGGDVLDVDGGDALADRS